MKKTSLQRLIFGQTVTNARHELKDYFIKMGSDSDDEDDRDDDKSCRPKTMCEPQCPPRCSPACNPCSPSKACWPTYFD